MGRKSGGPDLGLDFVVVGTPRSGTTLVQRLACELPGVGMPPETHFLGFFGLDLLRRARFPLEPEELRTELRAFACMDKARELELDVESVFDLMRGRCSGPAQMFAAVVRTLVGEARYYGEKSPEHLLWWRPLSRWFERLKFVAVLRDPRAVVASALAAWGQPRRRRAELILRAERWAADSREIRRAAGLLGERFLIVRYEDLVENPEGAKEQLASFLGVATGGGQASSRVPNSIILPREAWKRNVFGAVTNSRVGAWRQELAPNEVSAVVDVCAREMIRVGYRMETSLGRWLRVDPASQWRRARFRASRARHLWRIGRPGRSIAT